MKNRNKSSNMIQCLMKFFKWSYLKSLLLDPLQLHVISCLILIIELVLNIVIVENVPYTEIDWKAYMQECEGFLNGTLDYSKLRGETGPLVYPAGFVYLYSILYFLTGSGKNIKFAQYIFIAIYLMQLYFVLRIYIKTKKVPPFVLILTILTSYRIHSIYVLRLFNDPVAVLLFYISLNFFIDTKWYLGSIFYSLAVSVKMNILLYAPALFFFYLVNLGLRKTIIQLTVCAMVQLVLGLPFLLHSPISYMNGSFDVGRVFNHTWTVNYRFLDVNTFENRYFHISLLVMHILLLLLFLPMFIKYFKSYCRMKYVQSQIQPQIDAKNLENKRISKVITDNKKLNVNDEKLSKEQEEFLNSFEKALKVNKSGKKVLTKEVDNEDEIKHYSINFDVLTQLVILPMFVVNFIGVLCARSLHYQFYSWYFHSLPYLVWSTNFSMVLRFLILAIIEFCWNTYPSTNFSSVMLHLCHVTILFGIYRKLSIESKLISKIN